MAENICMEDMYPLIAEMLDKNGEVSFTVSGVSMQPMIYNRRDTVTLVKPRLPLKKYDLPFYLMDDGKFILHRVIKIHPDGTYECRGDNRWESEDNIRDDQIIGVVKSFTRNGKKTDVDKSIGYWLYTRTWKFLHPFKRLYNLPKRLKKRMEHRKMRLADSRRNRQKIYIKTEAGVMKKIEYREASAADMKQIYALSKKLGEYEVQNFNAITTPGWASSEQGQRYFQKIRKEHFMWVASCDGKVIAYCSGSIRESISSKYLNGELINLYIDDSYRGMGIGSKLIEILKDYCRVRGCTKLKVGFMNDNAAAEAVYSKNGFKPYTKTYLCDIED
ncbi:MAG: GNAT family N-acetyltransferase [Clostridia bacterium]|nr:GNAT family N-acetyltransferase [Clostridia bacterium]